jgi:hypothetical protein
VGITVVSEKEEGSSQPFESTKVTTLGDDFFKISSKIPFFMFSILMEGASVLFFTLVFILWVIDPDVWLLDELCIFATFSVFFFGLIILISVMKFFKPFMQISEKIRPIRFKVKIELFPVFEGNLLEDLLDRLNECFYLQIKVPKHFINRTKTVKGKQHKFSIFYENKKVPMIYIVTVGMVLTFLVAIFVEALIYSHIDFFVNFILLFLLEAMILAILIIVILRFFFRTEIIIVKKYDKKVDLQDVLKFKKECEEMVTWFKKPLILGMLSTKGFTDEAIDAVKYKKGMVHKTHTISLIEHDEHRFKLHWTG